MQENPRLDPTPQLTWIEREIDRHQGTEGVIAELQQALADGLTSFDVETYEEYGSTSVKVVVGGRVMETPEQAALRVDTETKALNALRNSQRAAYERLKVLFADEEGQSA